MVHPYDLEKEGLPFTLLASLHAAAKGTGSSTAQGEDILMQKCVPGACSTSPSTSQLLSHTQKLLVCSGIKTFPILSEEHDGTLFQGHGAPHLCLCPASPQISTQ